MKDATTGNIISGYSDVAVTLDFRNSKNESLVVGPNGGFAFITGMKHLPLRINVAAPGYELYTADLAEGQTRINVVLQPLKGGDYVRYSGIVKDAVTGKPIIGPMGPHGPVLLVEGRVLFKDFSDEFLYINPDGTFDLMASVKRLPHRITVVARGHAGYDADLAEGDRQITVMLRPVPPGEEVLLWGIVTDASTREAVSSRSGSTVRMYFSDSTDQLMWLTRAGTFQNSAMVSPARFPRRIVVTAPGYEPYAADLTEGQKRGDQQINVMLKRSQGGGAIQTQRPHLAR